MFCRLTKYLSLFVSAVLVLTCLPAGAQTFNCSSNNGQHQECQIPGHGNPNNVRMVRQLSQTPCVEGRTWGRHGNRVWVEQGCRADFAVGNGDYNGHNDNDYDHHGGSGWNQPPAYYAGDFRGGHSYCTAASGSARTYCQSGGAFAYANPIRMNSQCVQNRTWGVTQYGLWVSNGCSGEWEIKRDGNSQGGNQGNPNYGGGYQDPGWNRPPAYYSGNFSDGHSHCSAGQGSGRTYCQSGGAFKYANPLRVNSQCVENRTWGISQYGLWVANGCSGEWEIKR